MNIFSRGNAQEEMKTLVIRVETLERQFNGLKLEWQDALERITRMLDRMKSRQKALERLEEPQEPPALSIHREPGNPQGGMLTDHQKEIQQTILRRRAGG